MNYEMCDLSVVLSNGLWGFRSNCTFVLVKKQIVTLSLLLYSGRRQYSWAVPYSEKKKNQKEKKSPIPILL